MCKIQLNEKIDFCSCPIQSFVVGVTLVSLQREKIFDLWNISLKKKQSIAGIQGIGEQWAWNLSLFPYSLLFVTAGLVCFSGAGIL